jgi:uncharacterized membrane protein YkoI
MNHPRILAALTVCALVLQLAPLTLANPITLAELPEAVQKAINAKSEGGKLGEIEKVEEDDDVSYEVGLVKDGKDRDFSVDDEGALLSEQVYFPETPAPVQKTIRALLAKATSGSIDREFDDEVVTYELSWANKDGKDRSATIAIDGKVLSLQMSLDEVPAAARKVIEEHSAGAKLGDIFRESDEDGIYYDVEMTKNGKERGFTVGESGKLESMQVFLGETPPPVQKMIKTHAAGGKIVSIDKTFGAKPGEFYFEVEVRKGGKDLDFSVNSKGGFMGVDK